MYVYHETDKSSLEKILKHGIKRTDRGAKGDDETIIAADQLLDETCPIALKDAGVSRSDNLYGYITRNHMIIDITDGEAMSVDKFIERSKGEVLRLTIDPKRCYVSDLDRYDAVKACMEQGLTTELQRAVREYWSNVKRLSDDGSDSDIIRPEVMITYDISSEAILHCSSTEA